MPKHAFLSASGAPAWSICHAKPWREKYLPDAQSAAAFEGTVAHALLENALKTDFLGLPEVVMVDGDPCACDQDMFDAVEATIEKINEIRADYLYAEQRLDISWITGEEGAQGTADIVLIKDNTLIVFDFKYGRGVSVAAQGNKQLLIYAAAALKEFDLAGEIEVVRMGIIQPRLGNFSDVEMTREELMQEVSKLTLNATLILASKDGSDLEATPHPDACKFCRVKGSCQEYRNTSLTIVTDDFVDLDQEEAFLAKVENAELRLATSDDSHLATCMDAVDMIESWCKAVRGEVYKRLTNGQFEDGRYKLVEGKKGARKWRDVAEVSAEITHLALDDVALFTMELVSPAQAEKMLKKEYPVQWKALQEYHIMQSEPKPMIVKGSDKRTAVTQIEFSNLDEEDE